MIKVGLTGGIGSGKSTVAHIFEALNIPVYNADERAKYLMDHDQQLIELVRNHFGNTSYLPDGKLNRSLIADIVFKNKSELVWLNSIVHPAVGSDFQHWLLQQNTKLIIKESALLIETLPTQNIDKIIVVCAEESLRINRIQERDKMPIDKILQRINAQITDEERIKYADYIIVNDGKKSLVSQTLKIYKQLTSN